MDINPGLRRAALTEFEKARRKAKRSQLSARLAGRDETLLPFELIRQEVRQRNPRNLGVQQVALDQIVGSVGRYHEFNREFLPLENSLKERWVNVDSLAAKQGWPPVNLYKIGETYYVDDGNHRVSVARQMGNATIEANVMEFQTDATIKPDQSLDEILITLGEERFLELTQLESFVPDHGISFTTPGRYRELIAQIEDLRRKLSEIDGDEWTFVNTVPAWYEMVYLPTIQILDDSGLLDDFEGRTKADLFAWLSKYRAVLGDSLGEYKNLADLANMLATNYKETSLQRVTRQVRTLLGDETSAKAPLPDVD